MKKLMLLLLIVFLSPFTLWAELLAPNSKADALFERIKPRLTAENCPAIAKALERYTRAHSQSMERFVSYALMQRVLAYHKVIVYNADHQEWFDSNYYKADRLWLSMFMALPVASQALVSEALIATNYARHDAGTLWVLSRDYALFVVAQKHAEDMAKRWYYSHITPEWLTPLDRFKAEWLTGNCIAENIYRSPTTAQEAVDWWMNSELHRSTIINPQYKYVWIGYYDKHWVQVFACDDLNEQDKILRYWASNYYMNK